MKKLALGVIALAVAASAPAAYAQTVSHPSIRHEEWHYDYLGGPLVGHFIEYCNGSGYYWGYPGAYNVFADGDCGE